MTTTPDPRHIPFVSTIRSVFLPYAGEECPEPDAGRAHFLQQCWAAGFVVPHVYPCYRRGWDMDMWGGVGRKEDGELYRLETHHGRLEAVRITEMPTVVVMRCLRFTEEGAGD